jgi:membrane protease YdiL (CAAX protease family)
MYLWSILGIYLFQDPHSSIYYSKGVFNAILIGPIWEEIVFRLVPYTIAVSLSKISKTDVLTSVWIGSSVIFGLAHHNYPYGILYQGVYGLFFFLMLGKSNNLAWPIALHMLWNICATFL